MKKRTTKAHRSQGRELSRQQLDQTGGGFWGCDIFGAGVGYASSPFLSPVGAGAAGLGAGWGCNYVYDNGFSSGGDDLDFGFAP